MSKKTMRSYALRFFILLFFLLSAGTSCFRPRREVISIPEAQFTSFAFPGYSPRKRVAVRFCVSQQTTCKTLIDGMERASASGLSEFYLCHPLWKDRRICFGPVWARLAPDTCFKVDVFDVVGDGVIWRTNRVDFASTSHSTSQDTMEMWEFYCERSAPCVQLLMFSEHAELPQENPLLLCRGLSDEWKEGDAD